MSYNNLLTLLTEGPWDVVITCCDDEIYKCHYAIIKDISYFKSMTSVDAGILQDGKYTFNLPDFHVDIVRAYMTMYYTGIYSISDIYKVHEIMVLGDYLGKRIIPISIIKNIIRDLAIDDLIIFVNTANEAGTLFIYNEDIFVDELVSRIESGDKDRARILTLTSDLKELVFDEMIRRRE